MGTEPLVVPASLAQQSLWVQSGVTGNGCAYHVTALVRVTGPLRIPALERALRVIVDRHESLRTVFRLDGDVLVQVIRPWQPTVRDVRPIGPDDLDATVDTLVRQPFDLATGPLLRPHVLRLSPEEHVVVLVMHHIVTDAVSSAILLTELAQVYEAERDGDEPHLADLPVQYADYAVWHRKRLAGGRIRRLADHWAARLAGARPLGDPGRRASEPAVATESAFRWPERFVDRLDRLARQHGATPFMVLVAGFAAVLGRFYDRTDVTVVSPVEGRGRPELAGVVGYFINAVLIRVDLSSDPTVATLLARVRASSLDAFDHQELPIERIAGLLRRHGGPGADRICSGAMVVLQEPRPSTWRVADLTFELLPPPAPIAKADVLLDVRPDRGAFAGTVECDRAAVPTPDGAWLVECLTEFLRRACATPDATVADLIDASAPARRVPERRRVDGPPHADVVAAGQRRAEYVEPRTPVEAAVARVWQAVLGEEPIGALDNFFDLGGQSLAAVRLATRMREVFGVELSVAEDLYPDFTVAAVATRVAGLVAGRADRVGPALVEQPPEPGSRHVRASPLQEGVWAHLTPHRPPPLILGGVRVSGPLDVARLTAAFAAVSVRHETLHSTYREIDGELRQVIQPGARLPVVVREAVPDEYPDIVRAEVDRGFDLDTDVLARVVLLRFAEHDHAVLLVMHHLIGDRRSVDVLARDTWAHYVGRADTLPRLPVRFSDFARWHHALLASLRAEELIGYWVERLAGARPTTVPGDLTPRGTAWSPGAALEVPLPPETFDAVVRRAAESRVTLNTVGLTAFSALLARWTGDREICLRAPVSFRDASQVQDLVADFSNDVVIRLDLAAAPTFADLLRQVERVAADAFAHHELPPHVLEPHLPDPGLLSRLFRIQFTTEPEIAVEPEIDGLAVTSYLPRFPYAYRPLSVRFRHGAGGPKCVWIYQRDRFSAARIERLAADFVAILTELAADPGHRVAAAVGGSPDYGDAARA